MPDLSTDDRKDSFDAVDFFAVLVIWFAMCCILGPLLFYFGPMFLIGYLIEKAAPGWLSFPIMIVLTSLYFVGTIVASWTLWKAVKEQCRRLRRYEPLHQALGLVHRYTGSMSKFAVIIIVLCVIGGVFFGWYQHLVQKRAEVDALSWQYHVFSSESKDRTSKGATIESRDLAVDNVGGFRCGDFKRKREVIGIKAAVDIPQNAFITLDQLETVPVGYEDAMTGRSKQDLSLYTESVIRKRLGTPATELKP